MVQQLRHQVSNHSMQMMANELNFMSQNQQTIMGSASYWNPASQSWEQKGGTLRGQQPLLPFHQAETNEQM